MKKIIFAVLTSICCCSVKAQTTFEASDNYARLRDLTYDAAIQNKIYTISIGNHIDNGLNWQTVSSQDLNYVQSNSMDYIFDGNNIIAYIATIDIGVIKYGIHDVTLGTNNPEVNNPVSIYPNPANENATVLWITTTQ